MSESTFTTPGYEDLEISTQIVVGDALRRGITVTVLDRSSNFIKLDKNGKTEYVKQATKTSKDSYISFLIMENKSVSNALLRSSGLSVPEGETFETAAQALQYGQTRTWNTIVIKPTTTNSGLGITITDAREESFPLESAIATAFSYADTVIVEAFIPGGEYRFLVADFETIAVCQRVPAHVVGNGVSSVVELIARKNEDPRRGHGHITPLEKIELGETELAVLREGTGYDRDSIPKPGEAVFLRRNSNISTGGDSIDATDRVHPFYKEIAEKASSCVGAKICGVDLILPNPEEPDEYAILEVNFNPVLYIHNFPYQGANRQVGEKILDLLGF